MAIPSTPEPGSQKSAFLLPLDQPGRPPRVELPRPLTSFVGREHEVAAAVAALRRDGVRLLTLIGPGGVGKSRLALRVAEEVTDDFPDGIWFVPLAPVRDPALVAVTIAATIGVRETGDRPLVAGMQTFLGDKHALLLIDNIEHVLAAAPLVTDLLSVCPHLKVLATSRAVLRLSAEHDLVVPPLGLPIMSQEGGSLLLDSVCDSDAVRLFVERARAVRDDFTLTADNAAAIAEICRRLDGLPLAIELAAARSSLLPPAALLSRLAQRLPLLAGGPRDAPARLQTMRGAIAWSHDLLSEVEQTLFRRLAVFTGGFMLDAAEAVAGDPGVEVFAGVEALAAQSLVRPLGGGAEPRFAMLETVREYALERLDAAGEAEDTRRRHGDYFLALAEEAEPHLRRRGQDWWLARLSGEHENLRAALGWSLTADPETALRLGGALHWFWYLRGHWSEGRHWLEDATSRGDATARTSVRMKALAGAGILAYTLGDHAAARTRLEESIAIGRALGDPAGTAYGLHFLDMGALYVGDHAVAQRLAESVDLFRTAGDAWGLAMALCSRGIAALQMGDPAADALIEESLALARGLGDAWCLARALNYAGELARFQGENDRAVLAYEESLALYRDLSHPDGVARELHNMGHALRRLGEQRRSIECFAEALTLVRDHGDRWNLAHYLAGLAGAALALGEPHRAARLLGAASGLVEATGVAAWPVDHADHERDLAAARAQLSEAAFAAAWAEGRALTLELAVAEATDIAAAGIRMVPPSAPSGGIAGGLTPRELEVVRLLAEGKSDRQIAAELFISRRTAATHVASIFRKLDVASRSAAAAYAVRHGLD